MISEMDGASKGTRLRAVDYTQYAYFKFAFKGMREDLFVPWALVGVAVYTCQAVLDAITAKQSVQLGVITEALRNILLCAMFIMVIHNECANHQRVLRVIKYIDNCMSNPRYNLPEELEILSKAKEKALSDLKSLWTLFRLNFPMMVLSKPLLEVLRGNSWKIPPLYWSLSQDSDLAFFAVATFQLITLLYSHSLGMTGMSFSAITTQLGAIFDVVVMSINRIEERAVIKMEKEGLNYQDAMVACLQQSIAHHQELAVEMASEKPHLEYSFFAEMVNISLILACTVYPLIVDTVALTDVIKGVVFLSLVVVCTAVLCDRLEILADRNTHVFEALYGSPWYKCGVAYRRILLNGMVFAREPLTLKGLFFHGLTATRATFYNAVVNTFNILSMLRNFQLNMS